MKYITAEGPSSDIYGPEHPTGHTYLAAHEPARFMTEDEARNYFAWAMAETVAAMPAIDALLKEKNICPVVDDRENIKNLIYAETQPLREQLEKRKADENEHLDMVVNEWKARVRGLVQDNAVYKGFWTQEQAEHKRLGEIAAELRTQLDAARKAWEEMKLFFEKHGTNLRKDGNGSLYQRLDKALAQIDAAKA